MLMLPSGLKVWVASSPVNMRKSFDGLAGLVQEELKAEVTSGQLFVFHNRSCDKLKILYWDRNGLVQWYKRVERGIFRFPRVHEKAYCLTTSELSLLLEGIDLTDRNRFATVTEKIAC